MKIYKKFIFSFRFPKFRNRRLIIFPLLNLFSNLHGRGLAIFARTHSPDSYFNREIGPPRRQLEYRKYSSHLAPGNKSPEGGGSSGRCKCGSSQADIGLVQPRSLDCLSFHEVCVCDDPSRHRLH